MNLHDEDDCTNCFGGRYCSQKGLAGWDGDCDEGYYCLENEIIATPYDKPCPSGGYCPTGTKNPINCPGGTFNPDLVATTAS